MCELVDGSLSNRRCGNCGDYEAECDCSLKRCLDCGQTALTNEDECDCGSQYKPTEVDDDEQD